MMFPKGGAYVCNSCGKTMEAEKKQAFVTKLEDKETTVIHREEAVLPKTRIACPQCSHSEAFFIIRQTRAADEPETRIYRCCKCSHSWREY